MFSNQLIYPMFTHVAFTAFLYVVLTVMRAPSIWKIGVRPDGTNPWAEFEPRVSANLSNQFEWPLFFYIVCSLLVFSGQTINDIYFYLAWLFIFGRVAHSMVQIFTKNIRLRGAVFTINFLAVFGMWVLLFLNKFGVG